MALPVHVGEDGEEASKGVVSDVVGAMVAISPGVEGCSGDTATDFNETETR